MTPFGRSPASGQKAVGFGLVGRAAAPAHTAMLGVDAEQQLSDERLLVFLFGYSVLH